MTKHIFTMIQVADAISSTSECVKKRVGAVITDANNRILSTGYNGTPQGSNLSCANLYRRACTGKWFKYIDESNWIEITDEQFREEHRAFADKFEVHAEQNAIYNIVKTGVSPTDELTLYCTLEPCEACCKAIAGVGIKHVYYAQEKDGTAKDYLKFFGIECARV